MARVFAPISTLTHVFYATLLISMAFSGACGTSGASTVVDQPPEDCYPERELQREWPLTRGSIQQIGDFYAVVTTAETRRFNPCNLDKKWHREGQQGEFSGWEKKILPYERLSAIPFVLHHITTVDE